MNKIKNIILLLLLPIYLFSADYYWVGGSGDWSDISHWAAASGGTVTYSQAPGSEDDVFFDANSFTGSGQIVTANTDILFFRNMTWQGVTNNPTFTGPKSTTLNVFGEIELVANMTFTFNGQTRFLGENMNSNINYAGHDAGLNIIFEGTGGWVLNSPIVIDSSLSVRSGTLNTNGQSVDGRFLYLEGNGVRNVTLGSSVITLSGGFRDDPNIDYNWEPERKSLFVDLENLTVDPGTSRIVFTAEDPGFWLIGNGSIAFHDMAFTSSSGDAQISRMYHENEIDLNSLSFSSSAKILGQIDVQELNLTGGNVYEFLARQTFTIGMVDADGDCANGVIVTSTENGAEATFNIPSGNIDISFITLRDIHSSGGATFTASNGVDLGNNSGWSFTNSASQDFYWVGGSGDWTDPSHWSFTSGGSSSGCVPTGKDDVFFDVNSFTAANQAVTINKPNVYMHDMTWSGINNNGGLAGDADFRIRITGSLEFDPKMIHTFEGFYHFETSETGQTIKTNGIIFNRGIFFSGLSGQWTFLDDVEIVWRLNYLSGNLITNGQKVSMLALVSRSTIPRNLNIEGSHLLLRPYMYYEPSWEIENEGYQVQASNSKIEFSSHSGSFGHYGYSELAIQNYDTVLYSSNEGYVGINNWFYPEASPALIVDHLIFRGSGSINGSSHVRKMEMAAGHYYIFDGNVNRAQRIDEIVSSGDCASGLTQMFSSVRSQAARININQNYNFDRMQITDITLSGGTVNADNSIDGGNNTGVTFNEIGPRTLFWVGDGGFWQDPAHWSLTSGGPGGECIPTAIDDVFFDQNSFSVPNQEVNSYGTQYRNCHDITWTGTLNQPSFVNWYVNPTGSITYDQSFNNFIWRTVFTGDEIQTVTSGGQMFNWIELKNIGEVQFLDDLSLYSFYQNSGSFLFDDINVSTNEMVFEFNAPKVAKFGSSTISINGEGNFHNPPFSNYTEFLTVEAGNSTIDFTGFDTGFQDYSGVRFHNVIFSNPQSIGRMKNIQEWEDASVQRSNFFNNVTFTCNGETFGDFQADTLIGAAGKTYVLDESRTFGVDSYLQMIGNNCTPIELRSSESGNKATIDMPVTGTVVADFVQMQDIRARGGAEFNAGSRSTDIGNSNIGWVFEDAPDFVESGFLGVDRALCTGQDLVLDAYSFSPNEVYSWSDGSTDSTLSVNMPGVYSVEVEFESSCILRDTIQIFTAQDIMAMLPPTENICEGTVLDLNAEVPIATATYTWNTGDSDPILEVTEAGIYTVDIDVDGCISSATSTVSVVENPGLDLGGDQSVCDGEPFILGSPIIATSYLWQDGSTSSSITSIIEGLYWLEIGFEGCTFRDSSTVVYTPRPIAEIGSDTIVCSNEALTLTIENPSGHQVTWQDGSTANEISVTGSGPYFVILDDNGCADRDSIFVTVQEAPLLDLGDDRDECENTEITLLSNIVADEFLWSSGETTSDITINPSSSSLISLTITDDECTVTDEVMVNIFTFPIVDLGPEEQELCDNTSLVLDAGAEGLWQDGSITQTFDILSDGIYSVTVSNNGCETSASTSITVLEAPIVDLGEDIFECEGVDVILSVPEPALNFQWADGNTEMDRLVGSSGLYILEVEENNCFTRDSVNVEFQESPTIDLGLDTSVCDDTPFLLRPISLSQGQLLWEDGSTDASLLVESPGLIKATLTEGFCSSSDSIVITFKDCINFDVFIPNVFSPNEDGINDRLEVLFAEGLVIESYNISVFDRWGNRVYSSKSYEEEWDGKFNADDLPTGVYLYFINVAYIDDFGPGEKLIKGDVTIMN